MFEQMAVEIGKRGDVVFINMREAYNQNKLTVDMMQQLMQALDEAESYVPQSIIECTLSDFVPQLRRC